MYTEKGIRRAFYAQRYGWYCRCRGYGQKYAEPEIQKEALFSAHGAENRALIICAGAAYLIRSIVRAAPSRPSDISSRMPAAEEAGISKDESTTV